MIARRYWETVDLPTPRPVIAPGRALTGKITYLETHGAVSETYNFTTPLGRLDILAKGHYTITWGDGHESGPYPFEGVAWPEGRITHAYKDVGVYDIVVVERWTATWRLGGQSGVLRSLATSGEIEDFTVEQIQAVVR